MVAGAQPRGEELLDLLEDEVESPNPAAPANAPDRSKAF